MALWKTIFQHCQRNSVAILVQLTHLITPFSNKTAISPQSLQEMVTFIHSTINYDIPMSHLFDILPFSLSSTLFKLIGLMFFIAASSGSQWWTRDSSVNIWFLLVLPDLCNMRWLFFFTFTDWSLCWPRLMTSGNTFVKLSLQSFSLPLSNFYFAVNICFGFCLLSCHCSW